MKEDITRSTLALGLLALLSEAEMKGETGLHPYRMQQLIRERHKDNVINVGHRASLYRTIERLEKEEMVEVRGMTREAGRPERTTYGITEKGRRIWREWMIDTLSTPSREFPEFPAAISFLPLLTPDEVRTQLKKRQILLEEALKQIDAEVASVPGLPRLFLLEVEYLRAATAFELEWVGSIIGDLERGSITWSTKWLRSIAPLERRGPLENDEGSGA